MILSIGSQVIGRKYKWSPKILSDFYISPHKAPSLSSHENGKSLVSKSQISQSFHLSESTPSIGSQVRARKVYTLEKIAPKFLWHKKSREAHISAHPRGILLSNSILFKATVYTKSVTIGDTFGLQLIADNRHYEKIGSEVKDLTDDLPFEIPDSWVWCHLENFVLAAFSGKSPKYSKEPTPHKIVGQQANQWDGLDLRFVKYATEEFAENMPPYYYLQDGDVLLNTLGNGTLGRSSYYRKTNLSEFLLTDGHLFVFRTLDKAMSYYLKIYLKDKYDEIVKSANGSTNQTFLSLAKTLQWFVPVPPLSEQVRIVSEIEKFEPLIAEYDKLERQATKLDDEIYDKLKKSILQYAIQGKLVPQDPNDEPASVLLERIRAEKNAKLGKKFVDSYIYKGDDNCYYEHIAGRAQDELVEVPFDIPYGWSWCRLAIFAQVLGGKRIPAGRQLTNENTGHYYIKVSDMKENTVCLDKLQFVPTDIYPTISRYIINKEDVFITVAGTIGRVGTIPNELDGANLTENADRIVVDEIDQHWLVKCLLSDVIQEQIKEATTKVGQPKLAIARIEKFLIPLPPLAEQKRIVAKINEIFATL